MQLINYATDNFKTGLYIDRVNDKLDKEFADVVKRDYFVKDDGDNGIFKTNYKIINTWINDLSEEELSSFMNKLTTNTYVAATYLGDEDDEYKIFESINSKSVPLTGPELNKQQHN